MKLTRLFVLCLALTALVACQEEEPPNCRPNTYGIYSSPNLTNGTFEADVQEGAGEKGVIVVFTDKNAAGAVNTSATATGELDESCTTLTIPEQQVGTQTSSGTFAVTSTQMSGNVKIDQLTLTLVLTKQ